MCVYLKLCESGGQRTILGSSLFPHHLDPRNLTSWGHQAWRQVFFQLSHFAGPNFNLLFSNLTYHVGMTASTLISASWKAQAGGWLSVKGFEARLDNTARLSWNKQNQTSVCPAPTVHCPHTALSTISKSRCFMVCLGGRLILCSDIRSEYLLTKCCTMRSVASLCSNTFPQEWFSGKKHSKSWVWRFTSIIQRIMCSRQPGLHKDSVWQKQNKICRTNF